MKKVILVILIIAGYCTLSAGTPYYETKMNSDGNELPLVLSGETFYFLCDRTDMEMQLLKTTEENIPYFFNIYSIKENEPPFKEIKTFCIKSNQFPTFYSNSLDIAFKTEVNNKSQEKSLYNQAIFENYNCDNSEYSLKLNRYGYWTGQPVLSPSGKVLIFTSNMGGERSMDLFASIKDENGSWGMPFGLEQINTTGDEINPHFGTDGYFYYASNFKNDSIKDFDIYKATYIPKNGVLIPIDGKSLTDANSPADEFTPVQTPEKFYFSSTRKAENIEANIYSMKNEKSSAVINIKTNMNEIWVKNVNRSEYLCFPKSEKINLNKGAKYQIIRPEYMSKYYLDKSPEKVEFDFTKTLKDTSVSLDFNLKPSTKESFITISADKAPLFVRGYWKPFDKGTFDELRKREQTGFFNKSVFVDTTIFKYSELTTESENNQEQLLTKLLAALDNFNTFLPARDSLIIDLTLLSDEIDISGYKNKYHKSEKQNSIYHGETITVGKDKKGSDLIIPDGLDITESSWMVGVKKMKLSNDGNRVLAKLRAYYTYKYLDSTLSLISPIYKYYSLNKKLVFNYDGFVIDQRGDLPKDYIALSVKNRSSIIDEDKIEDLAKEYDYSVKPEKEEVLPTDDPNPPKPLPKMNGGMQNISKIKMMLMQNVYKAKKQTTGIESKQDTTYSVELFNMKDYQTAIKAFDILRSKEVKDVRFITAYDFLGRRNFIIRADKFNTLAEAQNALRDYSWVYSYVNLEGMATAVRE